MKAAGKLCCIPVKGIKHSIISTSTVSIYQGNKEENSAESPVRDETYVYNFCF